MIKNNSIVHLSDPHFGTENTAVIPALVQAVSRIAPEVVVVSGDLTQRARRSQFRDVHEFLKSLPAVHKLVVPGNHDIPLFNLLSRFSDPYGNFHKYFMEREGVILTENLILAAFDATTPFLHTRGKLALKTTRERMKQLNADRASSKLLGLVIHQPIVVARQTDLKNLLINSSDFSEMFSEFKVDFVLSGHIHFPLIVLVNDFYPTVSWATLFSGAGTAVSHRVRDNIPNSFNSLTFTNSSNEVLIQRHDFDAQSKEFLVVDSRHYSRDSKGWNLSSSRTTHINRTVL